MYVEIMLGVEVVLLTFLFARGLLRRGFEFEFPFMVSVISLMWCVPQQIALVNDANMSEWALGRQILMMILCILSVQFGWLAGGSIQRDFRYSVEWSSVSPKLIIALYSLFGGFFYLKFKSWMLTDGDVMSEGSMKGLGTIMVFLAFFSMLAFILSLYAFLQSRQRFYLLPLLVSFATIFDRSVLHGRRSELAYIFVVIGLGIWIYLKLRVPTVMIFVMLLIGAVFVSNAYEYRLALLGDAGLKVTEIDFWGNFVRYITGGRDTWALEIRNAAMLMDAVSQNASYDLGISLWDDFVQLFVPRQFVGEDLKNSLKFGDGWEALVGQLGYTPYLGTTPTGVATAFMSFGYLGCLLFAFAAAVLRYIYKAGVNGDAISLCMYSLLAVQGMHLITHQSSYFTNSLIRFLVFLAPILYVAKKVKNE